MSTASNVAAGFGELVMVAFDPEVSTPLVGTLGNPVAGRRWCAYVDGMACTSRSEERSTG